MNTEVIISEKIAKVTPSITLAISAKAKAMKKEGIDVVGFGAGEPDFDTPDFIKQACIKALQDGFTKYTPASGTPELKKAIIKKLQKDNGISYTDKEVIVCCGAKHALYNAICAICNTGDEVLIPSPYWVSYPEQVKTADAVPVIIETFEENNFKVTPLILEKYVTEKTKLFILNSPSNPTGMLYEKAELERIADFCFKKNILIISDEIYEKIIYDGKTHTSIASISPAAKQRTIVINGLSKSYSMTGWRIGYAAASEQIIKAMSNLQSHSTSNPTSFAQAGAVSALTGDQTIVDKMVKEFNKRREYLISRLNKIEGIQCIMPDGAFYAFPSIARLIGKSYEGADIKDSFSFCEILLDKAKVAAVPGVAFGADGYIRLSYATSMENLKKGLDRIEDFVNKLA